MATQILMPALSPTMEEGKLAKWLVKEGDTVRSGDILAEIETDKATMEFEAVDEGRIGKLLVAEGTEGVKVNQPIAVLLAEGEAASPAEIPTAMSAIKNAITALAPDKGAPEKMTAPKPRSPAPPPTPSVALEPVTQSTKSPMRIMASPLARNLATKAGIDLSSIAGTGPRGRIIRSDVEQAASKSPEKRGAEKPSAAPVRDSQPGGGQFAPLPDARLFYRSEDYEELPHDSMRRSIAKRLTSAKALIPHFYLTIECNIDELMITRARLNERAPKEGGFKLSVNDFVVKACALALMQVPEVNASWTEQAMLRHRHADIGVAVALDFGLITPIVFRAEEKGLAAISNEVKSLAERARTRKLKPQEFEGGTFAISNLGMFGVREFTAVINPPHAAILAVGMAEKRPVIVEGVLQTSTMMTVTLSCDHRVVDGATGARFLQVFKALIEDPAAMLL